jgi:hypothetical protein
MLDPAMGSVPPILLVFATIRNKYDARPQFDHSGVSIVLLDYLTVTALRLATELDALSMPEVVYNHRFLPISAFPSTNKNAQRQLKLPGDIQLGHTHSCARTSPPHTQLTTYIQSPLLSSSTSTYYSSPRHHFLRVTACLSQVLLALQDAVESDVTLRRRSAFVSFY